MCPDICITKESYSTHVASVRSSVQRVLQKLVRVQKESRGLCNANSESHTDPTQAKGKRYKHQAVQTASAASALLQPSMPTALATLKGDLTAAITLQ
jgi:hypothetical protein